MQNSHNQQICLRLGEVVCTHRFGGRFSAAKGVVQFLDVPLFVGKDDEHAVALLILADLARSVELVEEVVHVQILEGEEELSVAVQSLDALAEVECAGRHAFGQSSRLLLNVVMSQSGTGNTAAARFVVLLQLLNTRELDQSESGPGAQSLDQSRDQFRFDETVRLLESITFLNLASDGNCAN